MIKIPSSTNKSEKREERYGRGYLWLSLLLCWKQQQRTWESARMWICLRGCVITSHDMLPPPCLCKPFHPDPAHRERERESKLVHRPPLSISPPPPLRPSLPTLFPSIQICQWAALPLSRPITEPLGVESGPAVCKLAVGCVMQAFLHVCYLSLLICSLACICTVCTHA